MVILRFAPDTESLVGHHELVDDRDVVPPAVLDLVDAVVCSPPGMSPTLALTDVFFGLEQVDYSNYLQLVSIKRAIILKFYMR